MQTLPLNAKFYQDCLNGTKWYTIRQSAKYDFAEDEIIQLVFPPKDTPINVQFGKMSALRFGTLRGHYQQELLTYYPTLSPDDTVYKYEWFLLNDPWEDGY